MVVVCCCIQPNGIGNAAWRCINLGITRINIQAAIVVQIAYCEGFDFIVVEKTAHFSEGLIAIVLKNMVQGSGNDDVYPAIVVEIAENTLNRQPGYIQPAGSGNVGKDPGAVVDQQHAGHIMVGNETIHIAVVVNIAEISRPGLGADFQVGCCCCFSVVACAVIDIKRIDPARIFRVVHPLAAFGDVEVEVAIIVNIRPNAAVIT